MKSLKGPLTVLTGVSQEASFSRRNDKRLRALRGRIGE